MLYWLGDAVYTWIDDDYRFTERGYNLYRWLMLKSSDVQGDGQGPWAGIKETKL